MSQSRRPAEPEPKKSRSITMALLGAVTLCSCCCCLLPAPPDEPAGDTGGSNFDEVQEVAADGTPTTGTTTRAHNTSTTTHTSHGRSYYGGPFWLPLFFGGGSTSRGVGPGVNSPSRTQSPGGGVSTGGFGGTGKSMTGGGGSSSS